jgi:hypothetical protein
MHARRQMELGVGDEDPRLGPMGTLVLGHDLYVGGDV